MHLTEREWWTLIHGMILGSLFLLAFSGGLAGLYSLSTELITPEGLRDRVRRLRIGMTSMAVLCWLTVITGSWIVYPWYRAATPDSPRSLLLASPITAAWHTFGMEWKEHVAWISPILATGAAVLAVYYGASLAKNHYLRNVTMALFVGAFATAGIAGLFGALITKSAPIH